jgi:hypothetical protein
LLDEMFPAEACEELHRRGHDARAAARDLRGSTDEDLLDLAIVESRALVTENVVDVVRLLQDRIAAGREAAPVVFVLKSTLPRDAQQLVRALADRLDAWAAEHPDPFPTAHWL